MIFVIVLKLFRIPGGVTQQMFLLGGSAPRSNPLPFYIPFFTKRYFIYLFDFIIWFYYFAKHNELQAE